MNRSVIWKKALHVYQAVFGAGICVQGARQADARLAAALQQVEEQNLSWVMQARDRSTTRPG